MLLLWREERTKNKSTKLQSFVDLGCGNGLLVYILSCEGHSGYGIDLRKRGIWDIYPETTVLKVYLFFPDCNAETLRFFFRLKQSHHQIHHYFQIQIGLLEIIQMNYHHGFQLLLLVVRMQHVILYFPVVPMNLMAINISDKTLNQVNIKIL